MTETMKIGIKTDRGKKEEAKGCETGKSLTFAVQKSINFKLLDVRVVGLKPNRRNSI